MPVINFPANPSLDQIFTSGNRVWKWDGTTWNRYSTNGGLVGPTGPAGPTGPTGPAGSGGTASSNSIVTQGLFSGGGN